MKYGILAKDSKFSNPESSQLCEFLIRDIEILIWDIPFYENSINQIKAYDTEYY